MEYRVLEFPKERWLKLKGKASIESYVPEECKIPTLKKGDVVKLGPYMLDGKEYCSVVILTEEEEITNENDT
jgi:hypothetical protein